MRHPDASLAAYVEGTATARERATATTHLKTCPQCRREVKRAKAARAALAELPQLEPPGLDAAAIIQTVAAARAARTKRVAVPSGTAVLTPAGALPAEEWAPQTAEAVEEESAVSEGAEVPTPSPVEDIDVARRRRQRDRSRALRMAEAALGAAAVLVAIVLFIGLRNQPADLRSADGTAQAPESAQDAPVVTNYNELTLTAYAKDLVARINRSGSFTPEQGPPATLGGDASPAPAARPAQSSEGITCIRRATGGLVNADQVYEIRLATYLGQPAWIGAFVTDTDSATPTLLVTAVSTSCNAEGIKQLIYEQLQAPTSPSSP
jgi:hypothetical protein